MKKILQFTPGSVVPDQQAESGPRCELFLFPRPRSDSPKQSPCKWKGKSRRDTLISKVKIAQKQLGLSDSDYRLLLAVNF